MNRKKINLIVISVTLVLLIMIFKISSGGSKPPVAYTVIENENYDTPTQTKVSMRVTVKAGLTKDSLTLLCNHLFSEALHKKFKYSKQTSHIFIYVYDDTAKEYQANWAAMISRIMNENEGIRFRN